MKFLYKIHSGYDGFHPGRIRHRLIDGKLLRLGWRRYLDQVSPGDEVWIYFRGPQHFQEGVYVKGRVTSVDLAAQEILLRPYQYRTDRPMTDQRTSERVAAIVSVRYRQVFLLPEDWESVPDCSIYVTADSCVQRKCEWCSTWQSLPIVQRDHVYTPERASSSLASYAPAYWAIPPRGFLPGYRIASEIHRTNQIVKAFKMGNANLAYPLARGMFEALVARDLLDFDCVIPVPLSPDKAARGEIHRTRLLAKELGGLLGAPVREWLSLNTPVSKRRLLSAGYSYAGFERRYAASLRVGSSIASVRRILIVDDVCTRGGTLKVICSAIWRVNSTAEIALAVGAQMIVKAAVRDESAVTR